MSSGYEVSVLRTEDELRLLGPEWGELYAAAQPRNPFLSHEWTAGCWMEAGPGAQPFVIAAWRHGRLVGVAPLRLEAQGGFRVLSFIGDGRSDYLGFLTDAEHPGAHEALLEALRAERRQWDLAVLRQLAEPYSGLPCAAIPKSLRARGVEGTVAPYLAFPGEWDSLCATGPGWLKSAHKRVRRFQRDGGSVERWTGAEAAARVHQVAAIERRSWKGREGLGRFQAPVSQDLLRQSLLELGNRGEMELWLAWIDREPVAFEINFLAPGRLWLYQGSYHEEYRRHSPGQILDFLSIERAWKAGVREYDYLAGDEPYKADRTTAQRPLRYLALFPAGLRGWLAYTVRLSLRWRLKEYPPARAAFQLWVRRKGAMARAFLPRSRAQG